jgi:hypothetical protein
MFHRAVPKFTKIDSGEMRFASSEHDRRHREMNFVYMAGQNELPHGVDPAADLDVCVARSLARPGQSCFDAFGDGVKGRATQT